MANANDALPGTLKKGLIKGSSNRPEVRMKPVAFRISAATKNGNSEGKITYAHNVRPFLADARTVPDIRIRQRTKMMQTAGTNICLRYITLDGCSNIVMRIATDVRRISAKVI